MTRPLENDLEYPPLPSRVPPIVDGRWTPAWLDFLDRFFVQVQINIQIQAQFIGDGVNYDFEIEHGIGNSDVNIQVQKVDAPGGREIGFPKIHMITDTTFTISFGTSQPPPSLNQYRVIWIGDSGGSGGTV